MPERWRKSTRLKLPGTPIGKKCVLPINGTEKHLGQPISIQVSKSQSGAIEQHAVASAFERVQIVTEINPAVFSRNPDKTLKALARFHRQLQALARKALRLKGTGAQHSHQSAEDCEPNGR